MSNPLATPAAATAAALGLLLLVAPASAHDGPEGHGHGRTPEPASDLPLPPEPARGQPDAGADVAPAPDAGDGDGPSPEGRTPPARTAGDDGRSDPAPPAAAPRRRRNREASRGYRPPTITATTWRRSVREDAGTSDFWEPSHFVAELRFGPYSPEVDGPGGLYERFFDSDPQFYFGIEADWLPVRIPYVGGLGAGFGWGYTSASGSTQIQDSGADAGSDTSLTIHPMHISGVLRIDGPLRRFGVPIIPYAKIGYGMGWWLASDPTDGAEGLSTGLHLAFGGAIALNAFDETASNEMYEESGIRNASVFGEWMRNDLGGGNQLSVGTSTAVFGISLDWY